MAHWPARSDRQDADDDTDVRQLEDVKSYLRARLARAIPDAMRAWELAWDDFVKTYEGVIRNYARRSRVPDAVIEDFTQDVWMAVSRRLPTFEHHGQRGSLRAWFRTVVRHKAIDLCRRRARLAIVSCECDCPEPLDPHPDAEHECEINWAQALVKQCVADMRAECLDPTELLSVRIVEQCLLAGRKQSDVAREIDLSVGTVSRRYAASKEQLEWKLSALTGEKWNIEG
jgi:RNA polymerase sigma factor (sigma-70 family)